MSTMSFALTILFNFRNPSFVYMVLHLLKGLFSFFWFSLESLRPMTFVEMM